MPIHFNDIDIISEVAGFMNAQIKFRLPGNVSFENCKTVPIYRKQQ